MYLRLLALPLLISQWVKKQAYQDLFSSYNDSNTRGFTAKRWLLFCAKWPLLDLTVLGDYYTNGSYGMRFESSYAKKYSFSGNINFRYENLITSEERVSWLFETDTFNGHTLVIKANPNSSFSASVNWEAVNTLNVLLISLILGRIWITP
jgi:hypothetical protein